MLPERLFIGCGTKEYSATRDHVRWGLAQGCEAFTVIFLVQQAVMDAGGKGRRSAGMGEGGGGYWVCRAQMEVA